MSQFAGALGGLLAAAAPLGALPAFAALTAGAGRARRARLGVAGGFASLALLACAVFVSGTFLDFLDVSPENFQLAAGLVMIPSAARLIGWGNLMTLPDEAVPGHAWLAPVAVPLIAGPASLAGALSYATRFGEATTLAGAALAVAACALTLIASQRIARALGPFGTGALARLNGAALMVAAAELMLDGLHSV